MVKEIKPNVTTKYGEKTVATIVFDGAEYPWFMEPQAASQKLSGVSVGDLISITASQGAGQKYASYQVTKSPAPISGNMTGMAVPSSIVGGLSDYKKGEAIRQERISLAGFAQALIGTGKFDVPQCKQLARELVDWSKAEAASIVDEDMAPVETTPF